MPQSTEDNLERELEEVIPKKTVKDIRRHPLVYVGALIIIIVIIALLSVGYALANKSLKSERNMVARLNTSLQKSANELSALKDTLSKTEEGKKQLETAKAQVEEQNKQLDERATTAERTVMDVKADLKDAEKQLSNKQTELASATSDLRNKQAELDGISSDLRSKQLDLDKAKRGISKFDQAQTLVESYNTSSNRLISLIVSMYGEALNNNFSNTQGYIDQIGSELSNNKNTYDQIKTIFDGIKSGNY